MKKILRKKKHEYIKNRLVEFMDIRKRYIEEMTED